MFFFVQVYFYVICTSQLQRNETESLTITFQKLLLIFILANVIKDFTNAKKK